MVQGCEGLPPGGHVCGCGCALGSSQGRSKCLTPRREDIAARPCPWDLPALAVWPRTCCSTSLSLRCSLGPISAVRTDPETSRHGDISGWEGLLLLHEAARTPALSSPFSLRTAPLSVSSIAYFVCCKGFTPRAKNSNCTRGCPVLSQFPNPDHGPLPSLRCSHRTLGAPSGVISCDAWGSPRGRGPCLAFFIPGKVLLKTQLAPALGHQGSRRAGPWVRPACTGRCFQPTPGAGW